MLVTLSREEFAAVVKEKRKQKDENVEVCWQVMGALTACWLHELHAQKLAILLFILNRTLFYRKEAERIYHFQFLDGVTAANDTPICAGLLMSHNTLRKHLSEMCDDNIITEWRAEEWDAHAEKQPRLFAINFKKLVEHAINQGVDPMTLRLPKRFLNAPENAQETGSTLVQELVGGSSEIGRHNSKPLNLKNVLININTPLVAEPGIESVSSTKSKPVALPIPKKSRAAPAARIDVSATETVARLNARVAAVQIQRVASAGTKPAHLLDKREIQALFDKHMPVYYEGLPRVIVTEKELGLLRKRLKEAQVENFPGFVHYVVSNWRFISSAHAAARRKRVFDGGKAFKAMPSSPEFGTLAYSLPYFLKFYANYLADRDATKVAREETALEETNRRLKATVAELIVDKRVLINERRRARETANLEPARRTRIAPAPRQSPIADDDGLPPTWEQHEERERNERRG